MLSQYVSDWVGVGMLRGRGFLVSLSLVALLSFLFFCDLDSWCLVYWLLGFWISKFYGFLLLGFLASKFQGFAKVPFHVL